MNAMVDEFIPRSEILNKSILKDCFEKQIMEIEMIQSMYPHPGEFALYSHHEIDNINSYIRGETSSLPGRIDFTLNLNCEDNNFELCVNLPHNYPVIEPDIYVRSNALSRNEQRRFNEDICEYVAGLDKGDICMYLAIAWIQDNWRSYFSNIEETFKEEKPIPKGNESFSRFWIYSHHIYSKTKRDEILSLAGYNRISGFCLPGKPGIICIEGNTDDCEEWWSRIKSMNWKKITLKYLETYSKESPDSVRKFNGFNELDFSNTKTIRTNEHHMDMGELLKYLEDHNCSYGFNYYFAIKQ